MSDDPSECPECQAQFATHRKTCSRYPFRALDDPAERPGAVFERRVLQRIAADPRSVLAGDLLEMLVSQGDTAREDLAAMALACREAAEICYGKPPLVVAEDDFVRQKVAALEALRPLGKMTREEVAQAYPEVQGVDPGKPGSDRTIQPFEPSAAFLRESARPQPGLECDRPPLRDLYEHDGRPALPLCGAVDGPHVCALPAGHRGDHTSESGLVGWSWPKREPTDRPMKAMTTAVTDHLDDEEPRDCGAHPGVMLDDDGFIDPGVEGEPRSCPDSSLLAYGVALGRDEAALKEFDVPYRVVLTGALIVKATSAEQAEDLAEAGSANDSTFYNRAEITDWKVLGRAKEVR